MEKYRDEDMETLSEQKYQMLTTSFKTSKPIEKVRAIRDLIVKVNPDICLFTEVGGAESLNNFNQYFLNNTYTVLHQNSNSDRGIDLAALVNNKSQLDYKFKIHRQKVFARGLFELKLTVNNLNLHILLTHLKSKLNLKGLDFEGRAQRKEEVNKIIQLAQKILSNKNSEVAVCGDLNGIIAPNSDDYELEDFAKILGLKDVLDYQNTPLFDRSTFIYYNNTQANLMQLDYFLLQDHLKTIIGKDTKVLDFLGENLTMFP